MKEGGLALDSREEKVLKAAFNLLKYRERSVAELEERLLKKGYQEKVVQKVINKLKKMGYLDDKTFTQTWVKERTQKSYGPRKIKQELFQKGVKKELIEKELTRLSKISSEEENLLKAAELRLSRYQGLEPQITFRRLANYLLGRGFSPPLVYETCQKLLRNLKGIKNSSKIGLKNKKENLWPQKGRKKQTFG